MALASPAPANPGGPVWLEVTHVEEAAFGGRQFGAVGTYRRVLARAHGEVDPEDPRNELITDLANAPRNRAGRVEYVTDVHLLTPTDPANAAGLLVHDIVNRGNLSLVKRLNRGTDESNELLDAGDGYAMEQGYSILAHGWQADVRRIDGRLALDVPVATHADGSPITGVVRTEYDVTEPVQSLNLSAGSFVEDGTHLSYPTAELDPRAARLTRRSRESDPRSVVPPEEWAFADCSRRSWPGEPSRTHIALRDGFQPGSLYELVYSAKDPLVLGLGLAATRDLVAFLRHDDSPANPLRGLVRHAVAFGSSQSGRFIRSMLHLGFNADLGGRTVWDGVHVHVATGRAQINVRFGQLARGYGQREDHLCPQGENPRTWEPQPGDPSQAGGLLDRCSRTRTRPRIIHTLSATEYWQACASLVTTDAAGTRDLAMPDDVRMYLLAGTQHGPALEPVRESGAYPVNPGSQFESVRALFVALAEWVERAVEPPPSQIPTIADGTLVTPTEEAMGWPAIPGVVVPAPNEPVFAERGPDFDPVDLSGVITVEPPTLLPAEHLPYPRPRLLVPRVDADGNEVGGIRPVALRAALATHTGWNPRPGQAPRELAGLAGSYLAFATTRAERLATGDPRPSLEERYDNGPPARTSYVESVREATEELLRERLLLPRDAARLVDDAQRAPAIVGLVNRSSEPVATTSAAEPTHPPDAGAAAAAETSAEVPAELAQLRGSIDNIDAALIHLLAERFKCTKRVGALKAAHGLPPADPEREKAQIARLRQLAEDAALDPVFAEKFLAFIVAEVIHHHETIARNHRS